MQSDFTIHQLRLFLKIHESGSFSKAASALNLPQPSISRSISRIEAIVGTPLFQRSTQGVHITAAGECFREHAAKVVHHHDLAFSEVQQLHGQLVGEVRIATPESVGGILFFPLIKYFQTLHANVHIRVMTSASIFIPSLLDNDLVDIGIIANTHSRPSSMKDGLCREELYLIGPKSAAETSSETISLKQVAKLPLILNAMKGGFRPLIDEAFASRKLKPDIRAEIDANEPLLDLILDGEGFSILPYSTIAGKSRQLQLSAARIVSPSITRNFTLVTGTVRQSSAACREAAVQIRNIMHQQSQQARWIWDNQ